MKGFLYIVLSFLLPACNINNDSSMEKEPANDTSATTGIKKVPSSALVYKFRDTALEAKITDTLMKLPFVKKSNSYIDSLSDHTHSLSFILDTAQNEISVMAGYNGTDRFETYYNFIVNPASFEIKVQDPVSGELMSVGEFIKKNKQ